MNPESSTNRLMKFAMETPTDAVPPELFPIAKERFIDIIGVAMAGTAFQATATAAGLIRSEGGNSRSTAWGCGFKTTISQAGLLNGISAHSPDYDDITLVPMCHQNVVLIPAILTVAEATGATGIEAIAALAIAYEVESKIGLAVMPEHMAAGWHPPITLGMFGAATAASRLMGLTVDQARAALGIAGAQTSGIRKNLGSMTKGFHVGHAVRSGIHAAQLALLDFSANQDILDSNPGTGHDHFSFQETFNPGVDRLPEVIGNLGEPWELSLANIAIKRHPGATSPGAVLDALIDIVTQQDLRPEEISEIRIGTNPILAAIPHYPTATTGLNARYSLRYSSAVAMIDRSAGLAQFTDARVQKEDVQELLNRIHVYPAPQFQNTTDPRKQTFAILDVHCTDGRIFHIETGYAKGFPQNALNYNELVSKFNECADFGSYSRNKADQIRDLIENLDDGSPISALAESLGARK